MDFDNINAKYKRIPEFEDYYITELGDVYSMRLRGNEITPLLRKLTPKNPGKKSKYLNIILCNDKGQFTKAIHRLVAENFVDGYFDGAVVNHIDGNNRNNFASNLEWTTIKDNIHKSYITSGKTAKRNYKRWDLYDPSGTLLESFFNHMDMEKFIKDNNIDASPTQLTKKGASRGYNVIKTQVND